MENLQDRAQILKILFAQHPNEQGFYLTADGQAFTQDHKTDALNHAKDLPDKTVDWVENPKTQEQTDVNRVTKEVKNKKTATE